jgi:hypothetical protein
MLRRTLAVLAASLLVSIVSAPQQASAATWIDHGTSWHNPAAVAPRVIDLRSATHTNFDRVVIEIRGQQLPGYRTHYARHFVYDGSGNTVPMRGGLGIVLHPAYAHNNAGHDVYHGPNLVRPGFPQLKAIAMTGDFEGHVSFAFGLANHASYRIFRLQNPQRIVIDFQH